MKTTSLLFRFFKRLDLPTWLSVFALVISAISLQYARQSELRQLEHLVVSGGEETLQNSTGTSFEVAKTFQITNISERIVAIQKIELDLRRRLSNDRTNTYELLLSDRSIAYNDELNAQLKPGDSISVVARFVPTVGKRAAEFLAKNATGDSVSRLTALCRELSIDLYDHVLNEAQRQMCPSFRSYKGKHNFNFAISGSRAGDLLMLVVRTYRGSSFESDRYLLEIGNSLL